VNHHRIFQVGVEGHLSCFPQNPSEWTQDTFTFLPASTTSHLISPRVNRVLIEKNAPFGPGNSCRPTNPSHVSAHSPLYLPHRSILPRQPRHHSLAATPTLPTCHVRQRARCQSRPMPRSAPRRLCTPSCLTCVRQVHRCTVAHHQSIWYH